MMLRFFSFLLIVVTLGMTSAQIPGFGDCPRVKVVQPFKLQRYLGLWYEVKKYPFIFTLGGKCVTAEYGLNSNGTVSVYNQQTRNGKVDSISGLATIKNVDVATLGVTFPNVPFQREANYNVLDTDYDSFAVVYSCSSLFSLLNFKIVWILSRSRFPPQKVLDRAYEVMRANGLSLNFLATTDHNNCPNVDKFRN